MGSTGIGGNSRYSERSALVASFSGKPIADNEPVVGMDVFTQTAGVHADGDRKGALYVSRLTAERFGKQRGYALGKHSGRATVDQNLASLGFRVSESVRDRVLARVVQRGDEKRPVSCADLSAIVVEETEREIG